MIPTNKERFIDGPEVGKSTNKVLNLLQCYQFDHKLFNWINLIVNIFTFVPIQSI